MKKKLFRRFHPAEQDMSLNITAMADIFTVILVFLLKGFSGAVAVQPTAGLTLPEAFVEQGEENALKVEIARTAVLIESKPVLTLSNFGFEKKEMENNGSLRSLNVALKQERERQLLIAKTNADVKVDARVIIIADEGVPFATIKAVLSSAALNGYTDYKLAVVHKGG